MRVENLGVEPVTAAAVITSASAILPKAGSFVSSAIEWTRCNIAKQKTYCPGGRNHSETVKEMREMGYVYNKDAGGWVPISSGVPGSDDGNSSVTPLLLVGALGLGAYFLMDS